MKLLQNLSLPVNLQEKEKSMQHVIDFLTLELLTIYRASWGISVPPNILCSG